MSIFTGTGTALITPFNENGVDFESLKNLLDFQIKNKTDAILVCGTTGEPATMTEAEKKSVIEFSIKYINHRVPVIVGTGSNDTAHAIEMSKYAESVGADALLVVTPYYNKASQNGLYMHFKAIAEAVHTPIIMYNVPGRTGVNMLPKTVARLAELENIAAIKEASGNVVQVSEIIKLAGDKIDVYSGDDSLTLPIIAVGGRGVISVASNIIPLEMHDFTEACLNGDMKKAKEMHIKYLDIMQGLFMDVNPIPVKMAANMMGMNAGVLRLPLCEMESEKTEKLRELLSSYKLI